jgi:zinc and cadmium transporter
MVHSPYLNMKIGRIDWNSSGLRYFLGGRKSKEVQGLKGLEVGDPKEQDRNYLWVEITLNRGYCINPMTSLFWYMVLSVTAVSLLSLIGISLLALSHKAFHEIVFGLVALAVGALFGDAFLHLMPDAFSDPSRSTQSSIYIILGILLFFCMENFLHWRHQHSDEHQEIQPYGYLNILADMTHNFIDGLIIGASYLVSFKMGLATTLAVMLHEIPHEFSNFGILVKSGFSRWKALFLNFLTALTALLGGIIAWWVGGQTGSFSQVLIPLTAGGFIYIAGSDLVPQLHKDVKPLRALLQFLAILAGVGLLYLVKLME